MLSRKHDAQEFVEQYHSIELESLTEVVREMERLAQRGWRVASFGPRHGTLGGWYALMTRLIGGSTPFLSVKPGPKDKGSRYKERVQFLVVAVGSVEALAAKIGANYYTVYRWLHGQNKPGVMARARISELEKEMRRSETN